MYQVKIKGYWITIIFLFIFPLLPMYFDIIGVSAINIACVYIFYGALLYSLVGGKGAKLVVPSSPIYVILALWILVRCSELLIDGLITESLYFFLRTAILFWSLQTLIDTKVRFLKAINVVLYGCFVVCILGIIEEITRFNIFSLLNPEYVLNYNPLRFGILRILGFAEHTIVYGVYLMFCMSLCFYKFQFIKKDLYKRFFLIILYILMWINLILTLSRSIIICTFISQLLMLYFSGVKKFFKVILKSLIFLIPLLIFVLVTIPSIRIAINYGLLMILAVFNDKYSTAIASAFGNDNLNALGNRFDLYHWVAEKMGNSWLFGYGIHSNFSYSYTKSNGIYTWTQTKDSIEVQYLSTLYHYGLLGMITEIFSFVGLLTESFRKKMARRVWERNISFNSIALSAFLFYFIELFAVNQTSEKNIFYIFIILFLIYNSKRAIRWE